MINHQGANSVELLYLIFVGFILWFTYSKIFGDDNRSTNQTSERKRHVATIERINYRFIGIINNNRDLVISAYRNTVSKNNFGTKDYRRFDKELLEFINERLSYQEKAAFDYFEKNVRRDVLSELCQNLLVSIEDAWLSEITDSVSTTGSTDEKHMSPREYELYCAQIFQKWGWHAETTAQSGDQGVDVIATYTKPNTNVVHFKIAVQCKLFAKPVGNKAVQEILAGSVLHSADLAAVVAPNGFTRSAVELAEAVNVVLLHQDEIPQILEQFEK